MLLLLLLLYLAGVQEVLIFQTGRVLRMQQLLQLRPWPQVLVKVYPDSLGRMRECHLGALVAQTCR
jgi:hypothetical protein